MPEPGWRFAGQTGSADQDHAGGQMRVQVLPEDRLIERIARRLRSWTRMRVNQTGQQPAHRHQIRTGDRLRGPPVSVGMQVNRITLGQCVAAHRSTAKTTTNASCLDINQTRLKAGQPTRPGRRGRPPDNLTSVRVEHSPERAAN